MKGILMARLSLFSIETSNFIVNASLIIKTWMKRNEWTCADIFTIVYNVVYYIVVIVHYITIDHASCEDDLLVFAW